MHPSTPPTRHAFFDLDKTLTREFTLHQFGSLLYKNQVIDDWFDKQEKLLVKQFRAGQIPYRQAGEHANQILATAIKGLTINDLADHLTEFIHLPDLFRPFVSPVLSLLEKHHFQTHLISGSSLPIVSAVAHHLDFDTFIASIPEVDQNNQYTGQVTSVMDFEHKKAVMDSILSSHPDSALILGFGDSNGDIDMLSQTNLTFVIDPTSDKIISTAKETGWHITSDPIEIAQIIADHL